MYAQYWGFDRAPFSDPREFFSGVGVHDEALARLEYLIENRRALGLLTGESGSGKSLVLQLLSRGVHRTAVQVAEVDVAGLESTEFLWNLSAALQVNPQMSAPRFHLWRQLSDCFSSCRIQQVPAVCILDDVHEARPEVLADIVRLFHIAADPTMPLTLVLGAQTECLVRLGPRLCESPDLQVQLQYWTEPEVNDFLRGTFESVGCQREILQPHAVACLHELTGGCPRLVVRLVDLLLLAGAESQLPSIDESVVISVHQEFFHDTTTMMVGRR